MARPYVAPVTIATHPGVASCTPAHGGHYRHHVRLKDGWSFSQGRLAWQQEARFATVADFRFAEPAERPYTTEAERRQQWADVLAEMFGPENAAPERPAHERRMVSRAPAGWQWTPGSREIHGYSFETPDEVAARLAVTPCPCAVCTR